MSNLIYFIRRSIGLNELYQGYSSNYLSDEYDINVDYIFEIEDSFHKFICFR